jgi:hypothetical protein
MIVGLKFELCYLESLQVPSSMRKGDQSRKMPSCDIKSGSRRAVGTHFSAKPYRGRLSSSRTTT